MHTLTAVYDQQFYEEGRGYQQKSGMKGDRSVKKRHMWVHDNSGHKQFGANARVQEGLYLFGGANSQGHPLNDLWVLRPFYEHNARNNLLEQSCQYLSHSKPSLSLKISKIAEFSGQPPTGRFQHST